MTLDELIEKLIEAREHCVSGNSTVNVYSRNMSFIEPKDRLEGTIFRVDFNNNGANIYYNSL